MSNIVSAIQSLKPTAEFVLIEDDYSTITWHALEGKAPSIAEINAEIARLNDLEANAETARLAAKASGEAKLTALGLTADEIAALKA